MTIAQEVLDTIKAVAEGIGNVRKVVEAVRDGRAYLEQKHPGAKGHVLAMLEELRKDMALLREESSILTGFWFTVGSEASVATFNELCRKHRHKADELRGGFDALRGHCSLIRAHAIAMSASQMKPSPFLGVFELLGLASPRREAELAANLERLANEELTIVTMTGGLLTALKRSLDDVQAALGTDRNMDPANTRKAGTLLEMHSKAFEPLEIAARDAAAEIEKVVRAMA
ncbi:MAG: hypothetical protein JW751_25040 [Polyangiaceae bacterium]|nr:hypothetical protein [Polyangiaceae bacterium]